MPAASFAKPHHYKINGNLANASRTDGQIRGRGNRHIVLSFLAHAWKCVEEQATAISTR
jgi:hypothetical protein